MTDMRRTLLWVVFSMSLVLLWDAWNKHQGEPSIFGPRTTAPSAAPPAPRRAARGDRGARTGRDRQPRGRGTAGRRAHARRRRQARWST